MAGDTPTPIYDNKPGTPFEDGDGLEFRMASDFTEPYTTFNERQRVNDSYEAFPIASEMVNISDEINDYPKSPIETTQRGERLMEARIFLMDPKEVIDNWDIAA